MKVVSIRTAFIALLAVSPASLAISALPAMAGETAVAPEKNPPGDIPDNQAFVTYAAPQGVSFQVPEGWARKDNADGVSFADKYGRIEMRVMPAHGALSVASVRANEAPELEKTGRAVKIIKISEITLPAGAAIQIVFTSNSQPNPVTSKQIRLESQRILISHADKIAEMTFSAPEGADNVDQWTLMSKSFRWK